MNSDLILPDWPAPSNVVAATTTIAADLDQLPAQPVFLHQVHGATVVRAVDVHRSHVPVDADAVYATAAGQICAVRTADCLPLLLCATDGKSIAAVHGGWRGVAAGVIENAVAALGVDPGHLLAWLGPAISQPAFEVGDEVRQMFVSHDAEADECFARNHRGRWQADLYGLARMRLADAGVTAVYGGGFCTFSEADRFYSYRRDAECGRMVSFVYMSD